MSYVEVDIEQCQSSFCFFKKIVVKNFTFLIYLILILVRLGITEFFLVLILLELLSWLFSRLLPTSIALKYLLTQRYFVFWLISLMIVLPKGLGIVFLIKMGLPPIHLWFFFISLRLRRTDFFFFRTFHKLIPIVFLSNLLNSLFILMVIFGASSFLLLQFVTFFYVLFCSSLVHRVWIILSLNIRVYVFFFYFGLYAFFILGMLSRIARQEVVSIRRVQSSYSNFLWLTLSGIPPLIFFWLKAVVILFFLKASFFFYSFTMTVFTVIALIRYFRVFHLSLKLRSILFFYISSLLSSWRVFLLFF